MRRALARAVLDQQRAQRLEVAALASGSAARTRRTRAGRRRGRGVGPVTCCSQRNSARKCASGSGGKTPASWRCSERVRRTRDAQVVQELAVDVGQRAGQVRLDRRQQPRDSIARRRRRRAASGRARASSFDDTPPGRAAGAPDRLVVQRLGRGRERRARPRACRCTRAERLVVAAHRRDVHARAQRGAGPSRSPRSWPPRPRAARRSSPRRRARAAAPAAAHAARRAVSARTSTSGASSSRRRPGGQVVERPGAGGASPDGPAAARSAPARRAAAGARSSWTAEPGRVQAPVERVVVRAVGRRGSARTRYRAGRRAARPRCRGRALRAGGTRRQWP